MLIGDKSYLTKKKDIFIFTAILTILLIIAGYFYYSYEANAIRNEKYTELSGIAELKSKEITNWYIDESEDAGTLSRNPVLLQNIKKWLKRKNRNDEEIIYEELTSLKREHNYENILLTDINGFSLYSPDTNLEQIDSTVHLSAKQAILTKEIVTIDLYRNEYNNQILMGFVEPLFDENNKVFASMVFLSIY